MGAKAKTLWNAMRRRVITDPERWAGGSAVDKPSGLLAVEEERSAAERDSVTEAEA